MPELPAARPGGEALSNSEPGEDVTGIQSQTPTCSVIIPVFNNCFYTQLCLEALRQSGSGEPPYEIIVIDNGSTDDTAAVVTRFGDDIYKMIRNDENLGFAHASNQGAALARGRYVVFLNNDVIVQPGWLSSLVRAAQSDATIGAVGARLLYPDGTIQHAGIVFATGPSPHHAFVGHPRDWPGALVQREYQAVTGACMLVDRQLFRNVGGFDEGYQNAYEDIDFCFRIRQLGRLVVYNPYALAHHFESSTAGRFLRDDHSSTRFKERWSNVVVIDFEPSARSSPDIRGAGTLMHLQLEALSHRVRTLTAQNSQLLSLLTHSDATVGRASGIKETLASLFRPFDLVYQPDYLSSIIAGATAHVSVVITSHSTRTIEKGDLQLSYHWRRVGEPDYLVWDGLRTPIDEQLVPGCPASVSATVLLPPSSGYYFLEWDAIQEGVAWMSQRGVTPFRQLVAVRSTQSVVASIEGLPVMMTCRSVIEVKAFLKGDMESLRQSAPCFGWRWIAFDGQEECGWELGGSGPQVEGEKTTLGLTVKAPWRSGCYLLEIGRLGSEEAWVPLTTIGGTSYVLANGNSNHETGESNVTTKLKNEARHAALGISRQLTERQWLPGEAEYCLARIEQLLLPPGSRLEAAKLQSLFVERVEKEHWPAASRIGELEWAIRRWLAEFAELERQLRQERQRTTRLANMVDSYRKNRVKGLLALLDRLPFWANQRRETR